MSNRWTTSRRVLLSSALLYGSSVIFAQTSDPCTAPQTCATLIDTHAQAHTRIPNTTADIQIGLTTTQHDLVSAQRALGEKSRLLLAYLRQANVERLTTTAVSFAPDTKSQRNGPDRTVSYTGTSQISFRTAAERAPEVLTGVLSNGGSSIDSTSFLATEEETLVAQRGLAAEATRAALAEAETIAKAAGLHMASVRSISVNEMSGSPRIAAAPMMAMKVAAPEQAMAMPPIATEAGDQELSVTVHVVVAAIRDIAPNR